MHAQCSCLPKFEFNGTGPGPNNNCLRFTVSNTFWQLTLLKINTYQPYYEPLPAAFIFSQFTFHLQSALFACNYNFFPYDSCISRILALLIMKMFYHLAPMKILHTYTNTSYRVLWYPGSVENFSLKIHCYAMLLI